jgi:hypothetical protein
MRTTSSKPFTIRIIGIECACTRARAGLLRGVQQREIILQVSRIRQEESRNARFARKPPMRKNHREENGTRLARLYEAIVFLSEHTNWMTEVRLFSLWFSISEKSLRVMFGRKEGEWEYSSLDHRVFFWIISAGIFLFFRAADIFQFKCRFAELLSRFFNMPAYGLVASDIKGRQECRAIPRLILRLNFVRDNRVAR